jgi:L-ascorbate metabolism protein UlaG (beta-lactamase superfamily)
MKSKNSCVQLLRHATLIVKMGDLTILVDPMLSVKDALDPVQNAENNFRFPMVDLPLDEQQLKKLINEVDLVLITHTHRDHWDVAAQTLIEKTKAILCQPSDFEKIKEQGFTDVHSIEDKIIWKDITIHRTGGQHGTGEIGKKMGEVSGFVLTEGKDNLYIAGDTIWCDDVEKVLHHFKPTVTVVNAGAAQFLTGDPITMTPEDIDDVCNRSSGHIIAVHMDTVNHCLMKRKDLKKYLVEKNLTSRVTIPSDGETIFI